MCRLESVSLMSKEGKIVERSIEGWIIGEDGRPGIKGTVVDKASNIARMSVFNGILGGMASFFQNQASSSIYPISPIIGQTNALKGSDALKSGAASGVGNALQKLADYAIKRAEQMNPVIAIGSGREVDVVFKKGFLLEDEQSAQKKSSAANLLQQVEPVQQEVKNAAILSFDDLQNSSEGNF
jgi:conjugal transfer pilus assembly protein TraB